MGGTRRFYVIRLHDCDTHLNSVANGHVELAISGGILLVMDVSTADCLSYVPLMPQVLPMA